MHESGEQQDGDEQQQELGDAERLLQVGDVVVVGQDGLAQVDGQLDVPGVGVRHGVGDAVKRSSVDGGADTMLDSVTESVVGSSKGGFVRNVEGTEFSVVAREGVHQSRQAPCESGAIAAGSAKVGSCSLRHSLEATAVRSSIGRKVRVVDKFGIFGEIRT